MKNGTLKYCIETINKVYDSSNDKMLLRKVLVQPHLDSSTIDNYRNYLTKAGYLKVVGRGKYEVIKRIPENSTLFDILLKAYPKRYPSNERSSYFKKELLIEKYEKE